MAWASVAAFPTVLCTAVPNSCICALHGGHLRLHELRLELNELLHVLRAHQLLGVIEGGGDVALGVVHVFGRHVLRIRLNGAGLRLDGLNGLGGCANKAIESLLRLLTLFSANSRISTGIS